MPHYPVGGAGFGAVEIFLQGVRCNGTEYSLQECSGFYNLGYTNGTCADPYRAAGVICYYQPPPECYDGDIRLANESYWNPFNGNETVAPTSSTYIRSGTVLVCVNGTYGAVCAKNWDNNDAAVVCRNLGFYPPRDGKFLLH